MKFYAYKGKMTIGKEPLGTSNKLLFELKTYNGAISRAQKYLGREYSLYSYTNFYNDKTFRRII